MCVCMCVGGGGGGGGDGGTRGLKTWVELFISFSGGVTERSRASDKQHDQSFRRLQFVKPT